MAKENKEQIALGERKQIRGPWALICELRSQMLDFWCCAFTFWTTSQRLFLFFSCFFDTHHWSRPINTPRNPDRSSSLFDIITITLTSISQRCRRTSALCTILSPILSTACFKLRPLKLCNRLHVSHKQNIQRDIDGTSYNLTFIQCWFSCLIDHASSVRLQLTVSCIVRGPEQTP